MSARRFHVPSTSKQDRASSATQQMTRYVLKKVICPPCGAAFISHDDEELVAIVQHHALRYHDHSLSRDWVIGAARPVRLDRLEQSFGLTAREAELLRWVVMGKSNPEISIILGIRPRTVGKHMERIFAKLNVSSRTAATALLLGQTSFS